MKRIIPILHRACDVPEDLNTLQIISFLEPKPYQSAIDELLIALQRWPERLSHPYVRTIGYHPVYDVAQSF